MLKKIGSVVVAFVPLSVFAAVPPEATAAMNDMKTDALAVATVFLVATIAIAAFMYMRKPAK